MSVKLEIGPRIEIAPGISKYELIIKKGRAGIIKPKIDEDFAKRFANRLKRESRNVIPPSELLPAK